MSALLRDVRALWRRERALIVAVGAPFLFLPNLAVQLLTPPVPARGALSTAAWFDAVATWGQANVGWYLLADAVAVFGAAALTVLLADPTRPTVSEALARAGRLWPRFVLASVLVAVPVNLGMWLILPGLFFQARFALAAPVLVREPRSAASALGRSWTLTERASGAMFVSVAALFALWWLLTIPLAPLDGWLRAPAHHNPFVLALVDAGMAMLAALYQTAVLLLGVVGYRRLAS
jgi:hypothetical protein